MQVGLILVSLYASAMGQAQTCEAVPHPGTESMTAHITIKDTNIPVTEGMVVPIYTILQIDSVATATGTCTGMAWTNISEPTCEPDGYTWYRVPNHTQVSVEISSGTELFGFIVGIVWGTGGPDQHVLNTESSDTTGPNTMYASWKGTYKFHIYANINAPCNMAPYETEEKVITVHVGDDDGATDSGPTCKNSVARPINEVGEPINVTNGNMYIQQTDYRLQGFGAGLEITRTYNSRMQRPGLFGFGWSSILDESIKTYNSTLMRLNLADGRAVYFARPGTTAPYVQVPPGDFRGQVVQNVDNTYTLTLGDGAVHQFDASGKLLSFTDPNNNSISLSYDGNGRPVTITDAAGRTVTLAYDSEGKIGSMSDSTGTIATYTHWIFGILTNVTYADGSQFNFNQTFIVNYILIASVTDALGNVLESHTYDSQNRALTSEVAGNGTERYTLNYVSANETDVTDALNHVTKYFFDRSKGRNVVTQVEGSCSCGSAQIQSWTYDNQLNVLSKTDALSHTTSYTYDTNGNRLTQTDATGTTTYTYNSLGEVLTRTDQMNGVWTNTYDAQGNLLTAKDPLNNTKTLTYDSHGQLLTVTDPRNNATTFTYDSNGNLTRRTDALNNQTNIAYDARGRVTSVTNALNQVTSYEYDVAGRLKKIIYPDTNFVLFTYDLAGRRTKIKDPRGYETNFAYDSAYRLTSETNADNKVTSYAYDVMSNLTGVTDALYRTTNYSYDDFNRLTKIKYPEATAGAGRLEENFTYDSAGNLLTKADQAGRITSFCYDTSNRLASTIDPAEKTTAYEYNARSQMTAVVDAINQRYEFVYDPLGRVTQNKKGTATMSFVYDAAGNRSQRTDYNNEVTNYTSDALNRLTTISYPDATSATYGYDVLSRLTTATNPNGTVTVGYDNRSRISSVTDVFGQVVGYAYDANSNRTQLSLNGGTSATYQFDVLSRLTQLADAASLNTTFGYDATNKLTSRNLPNDVATTYQYDGLDRLIRLTHSKAGNTLADFQYQFNTVGNITQLTDGAGAHNYAYDSLDRLTAATHPSQTDESYTYDDVGNRTASHQGSSYTYQTFNRVVNANGNSYGYDMNGNLTSKADASGNWIYNWDYENRLNQATLSGGVTVTYAYDALGRRVERTSSTSGTTKFVYDGADVLRDLDGSGAVIADYLNGPGIDNKIRQSVGGVASYFVNDHLGTTRALANSAGLISSSLSYDSFGNLTSGSASTRFTYTGREIDSDTVLMHYRARWYDPSQGRFTSEDPIGFEGGDANLYGYVWRRPLSFRDPLGLDGWGNDVADWLDGNIGYANQYWQYCDQEWVANGINNSVADLAFSVSDLLRVGNGLGHAIYADDENGYGRAAFALQDVVRAAALFNLLGGSATRLTPRAAAVEIPSATSEPNTLRPGPYAGRSIPARGPGRDFNAAERNAINEIGGETGCHTCGTTDPGTKSGNFIPDHQLPNALNPSGAPQRLYPHCLGCSRVQGGQIRQLKR
jgi:RHS repeat-associated protein